MIACTLLLKVSFCFHLSCFMCFYMQCTCIFLLIYRQTRILHVSLHKQQRLLPLVNLRWELYLEYLGINTAEFSGSWTWLFMCPSPRKLEKIAFLHFVFSFYIILNKWCFEYVLVLNRWLLKSILLLFWQDLWQIYACGKL